MSSPQALRVCLRRARRSLTQAQQRQAAKQLLQRIRLFPPFLQAKHIALYLANDGELDLKPVIDWCWQQHKQVYLPVLHPLVHNRLLFCAYTPTTPMRRNRYGIWEPRFPYRQLYMARQLDLVLLPLVGFDHRGGRLGMGGGFYDRTFDFTRRFGQHRPCLIGVAHELQRVASLTCAAWDVPVHYVITDRQCYQAQP